MVPCRDSQDTVGPGGWPLPQPAASRRAANTPCSPARSVPPSPGRSSVRSSTAAPLAGRGRAAPCRCAAPANAADSAAKSCCIWQYIRRASSRVQRRAIQQYNSNTTLQHIQLCSALQYTALYTLPLPVGSWPHSSHIRLIDQVYIKKVLICSLSG